MASRDLSRPRSETVRHRHLAGLLAASLLTLAPLAAAGPATAGSTPPPSGLDEAPGWRGPVPQPPHAVPRSPVDLMRFSARFGERGSHWRLGHHTGLDFVAPTGTPVRAVVSGRVVKLAWNSAWGRMVILEVAPGVTVWYCHLSRVLAKVGPVARGQVLGRVGTSGNTSGPHLHLEVPVHDRATDPAVYLYGPHAGTPGPVPTWYPRIPFATVASLAPLGRR
jgi:murein DD-endopeptidase MepM/ murein hydrolase activator NlpD